MIGRELLAAPDFTMVRAELVRALGGDASAALVLTRIHWRLSPLPEGSWWRGTAAEIADETGLSIDQVNRAVKKLRLAGHLETTEERAEGTYDRTLSYRLILSGSSQTAESRHDTAESRPLDTANSRSLPLSKTKKTKNICSENREAAIAAWVRSDADKAWQRERDIPSRFTWHHTERWKIWLGGSTPAAKRTVDFSRSWRNWMSGEWAKLYESQRQDWLRAERDQGEVA